MALEQQDTGNQQEMVEHLYSPVVETIAMLSSLVHPQYYQFAVEDRQRIMLQLSDGARQFISHWQTDVQLELISLFNFLLPCPCFYDMQLFRESLSALSPQQFTYYFFDEALLPEQIGILLASPVEWDSLERHLLWENEAKKHGIAAFLSKLAYYRQQIDQLLLEISRCLDKQHGQAAELAGNAMAELQQIRMEPLPLAQFVMGKSFRRVSLYRIYYFIPSYYFTPRRIRVFNQDVCLVIYGAATPLSDIRVAGEQLEAQIKALADRNRLMILRLLSGRKEYGAKIAEYLGITTATVSHHLEILKKAGLVQEEKIGTIKYFTCSAANTTNLLQRVQGFIESKPT